MISQVCGMVGNEQAQIHYFEDVSEAKNKGFSPDVSHYWTIGDRVIKSPVEYLNKIREAALSGKLGFGVKDMQRVTSDIHKSLMAAQKKQIDEAYAGIIKMYEESNVPGRESALSQLNADRERMRATSLDIDGLRRDRQEIERFADGI